MNLLIFSFISAIIDWFSVLLQIKWIEYIFKPLTVVLLILWFFRKLPSDKPLIAWIILAGLIFSLFGDIFLMLPGDWFLAGLIAFLVAQIAYTVGFNSGGLLIRLESTLVAVVIFAIAAVIYLQLRNGLKASGSEGLIPPVTIYVIVISIMLWSASTTFFRDDWLTQAAILVTIGAGFFYLSDAVLGWNRFVNEIPRGNLLVIMTYHTAQYLISFGVLCRLGLLPDGLFG
jgi:uncharacterized membrane protein YhhN